jgi:hypothetical protein
VRRVHPERARPASRAGHAAAASGSCASHERDVLHGLAFLATLAADCPASWGDELIRLVNELLARQLDRESTPTSR